MVLTFTAVLTASVLTTQALAAAVTGTVPSDPGDPQRVQAVRTAEKIVVDGVLSDAVWRSTPPISNFVQRDPIEGLPPSQKSEVFIAFDDAAIYIAARLYDTAPDSIVARLARRDRWVSADRFMVYLDPYHDRRSGVYFGINAAGTQYDGTLLNDDWDDDTWDGVWQGKARVDSLGWTVEMRIPFSQLRFKGKADGGWGINFSRLIGRNNERDYLVFKPRNASGFVSRFPEFSGFDNVRPPRRIEVVPYVSGRADYVRRNGSDPFNDGSEFSVRAGGDVKMGIGGNLTLDGTVLPDFGQVEVDPAVVNLTDVEVFFPERRPFFVEGANIFNGFGGGGSNNFWGFAWSGNELLYSRRIGGPPHGSLPQNDYADIPGATDILGAVKLSGKLGSWNVGTLHAFTQREYAHLALADRQWSFEVEPFSYYGATRVQKEINGGRQALGFIGTTAIRDLGGSDLENQLDATAFTLGLDGWTFLDQSKTWVVTAWTGASRVSGTTTRMIDLQQNSVHYFQRPDQNYMHLDSSATSLSGYAVRMTVNKQKGNVQFNAAAGAISPGWEINDLGYGARGDLINGHVVAGYRWPDPGKTFRQVIINTAAFANWDFGGVNTWKGLWQGVDAQLLNFWWTRYRLEYNFESQSVRRTRGGPSMLNPTGWSAAAGFDSDDRKPVRFGGDFGYSHQSLGANNGSWYGQPYVEWQPIDRLLLRIGPSYEHNRNGAQYLETVIDPAATATYGNQYLFGDLDQHTVSGNLRVNWIFSPKLSLELYAQPLVSSVQYTSVRRLAQPGTFDLAPTDLNPADYSYSFASLRGNAVLRWEFHPGSALFLVWNQNQQADEDDGSFNLSRSLGSLWSSHADNVFMIKATYWWSP